MTVRSFASSLSELSQNDLAELELALDKTDSEESLRSYLECAWHIVEPNREFVPGWHIDATCEHLEAVSEGHITRLLINIPPGCMKSLTTNVFFPSWEWGPKGRPDLRYVGASYSEGLTVRDNRRTRNIIQSDWYQQLWGDRFHLTTDQNAKIRFDTNHTGFKIATSTGGLGTGERGDRFIIDDPHNVKDGESEAKRRDTLLWFSEVVPTRLNDPEESAIIVIMQRVHEDDVSGLILERELGYTHLMLPMEFDPQRKCYIEVTGFEDPRAEENELLWPERMPRQVVERDKRALGSYASAGQFQQRPSPRGGGMFQYDWFEFVDAAPAGGVVVRAWDLAGTKRKKSPWTVGVKGRYVDGVLYIEDVCRFKGSPGEVERKLKNIASQDGPQTMVSIPQDPGQAGLYQKTAFAKLLREFNVRFSPETGSKEQRAEPVSAQAEAGNVKIVKRPWNGPFMDEITVFPLSKYKDQVDALSRLYSVLIKKRKRKVPHAPEVRQRHG